MSQEEREKDAAKGPKTISDGVQDIKDTFADEFEKQHQREVERALESGKIDAEIRDAKWERDVENQRRNDNAAIDLECIARSSRINLIVLVMTLIFAAIAATPTIISIIRTIRL